MPVASASTPAQPAAPMSVLGIDIAKSSFDVALLRGSGSAKHRSFKNHEEGFSSLTLWLTQLSASPVHACMEATGMYGDALARYLVSQKHIVSIVNPSVTHAFAVTRV